MKDLKKIAEYSLHCNKCGKDVFKSSEDYFMLKDEVWAEVCDNPYTSKTMILCKDCTEVHLGRKLKDSDYTMRSVGKAED